MQENPKDHRAMLKVGYYHQNDSGRESAMRTFAIASSCSHLVRFLARHQRFANVTPESPRSIP